MRLAVADNSTMEVWDTLQTMYWQTTLHGGIGNTADKVLEDKSPLHGFPDFYLDDSWFFLQ